MINKQNNYTSIINIMGNNITFNPEKPNENIINMVVEDIFDENIIEKKLKFFLSSFFYFNTQKIISPKKNRLKNYIIHKNI